MRDLDSRLAVAKTILQELSKQSLSRTMLDKKVTSKIGTHATFEGMFIWLVQKGYIKKIGQNKRDPYCVTEKGRKLLEALP